MGHAEAHGTGTLLGDPVEVHALAAAYGGAARPAPLVLGAAKAAIGHTEGAAGLAGLVKVALSLRARQCPAVPHFATPNPNLPPLAAVPAVIPTALHPWPGSGGPRLGAVSAFGFSGTGCCPFLCQLARKISPSILPL